MSSRTTLRPLLTVSPLLLAAAWVMPGCSDSDAGAPAAVVQEDCGAGDQETPDAASEEPQAPVDGSMPETSPEAAMDATQEEASGPTLQEQEPNDGSTLEEHNALPVGAVMQGAIDKPGDADIFRFEAVAGKAYVLSLEVPQGSVLQAHLTAMDDGRGSKPAGDDYVKLARSLTGPAGLELLAMGQGGYYVVVRDARNISSATVGGAEYRYTVTVAESDPKAFEAPALTFPANLQDKLDRAGGLRLYPFTATQGQDAVFDLKATGSMDGRLMVYAASTGSWIARNDDRSAGDPDPLIDATLYGSGAMWLVVENIDEKAGDWAYTLQGTLQ
jgi:hypothetical protein